jgi:hypothetical protein
MKFSEMRASNPPTFFDICKKKKKNTMTLKINHRNFFFQMEVTKLKESGKALNCTAASW